VPLFVIDESNYLDHIGTDGVLNFDGQPRYMACKPRPANLKMPYAAPSDFPIIPRSQWPARIKALENAKATIRHICDRSGPDGKPIPSKDQNGTNYCHANSPAYAIEVIRAIQGEKYVEMSAGSIGGKATGYQNAGAWIPQDLEVITKWGCASTEFVPPNQISKSGWKQGAEENGKLHRVTHWWDMVRDRMFDRVATMVLQNIPVCVAYNWWSHAVTAVGLVEISSGRYGFLIRNSWGGSYGDNGYFILAEGKGTPDEAYAPRMTIASVN